MATFSWHITDPIPSSLSSEIGGAGGLYSVTVEDFDIAIGNLPFLLYAGPERQYERSTAQWRKDQFDNNRDVGEQSLTGWWLRSQSNFSGGSGIEFFEPLLGEGSETRYRDSRGVDAFNPDTTDVTLLHETVEGVDLGSSDVEVVAGPTRVLIRNGGSVIVWNGTTDSAVSGTSTAAGLAEAGSVFLVGDVDTIYTLAEDTGTSLSSLWTNFDAEVKPFFVKQRIIAASGPELYELTLAGGDSDGETPLYTHPDNDWVWSSVTETGGAIWAAGSSGDRSAVHVFSVDATGATPTLTAATVAIQLPHGETVNQIFGYLDFLLVATSAGFRVALTQGDQAALGPLVFRDLAALSLAARGDFAHVGLADGLTRRVDLGNEAAGDLAFAWANDLEGAGDAQSLAFFGDRLCIAGSGEGLYVESATDLVASGFLTTGFIRFGTLENKHYQTALVSVDATNGAVAVAGGTQDPPTNLVNLALLNGSRNIALHVPGGVAQQLSLTFTLTRDGDDATLGPSLMSYQIRAVPAPTRRQRLIRFPLSCFDYQKDRNGIQLGGPGFAWARLRELEAAERNGAPLIVQDFRTGEARTVIIEQIQFSGPESPSKSHDNFGGTLAVTLRTVD
jgi:hypothetical protein